MSNICRLCYDEKSSLDFTVELKDTAQRFNQTYRDLIEFHSRIELDPSKLLPQFICEECRQTIENFVELTEKIRDSQQRLKVLEVSNEKIVQYIDETGYNVSKFIDNLII